FFFQAEDGIRDKLVTGVQTCALPIFTDMKRKVNMFASMACSPACAMTTLEKIDQASTSATNCAPAGAPTVMSVRNASHRGRQSRSEERRVGKGCGERARSAEYKRDDA